jgi:hypothetical protein
MGSSFDLGFRSARTDGLDRRERPSGALESAQRFRGRGREPGRRVSSGAKRRASHDDRNETDRPRLPVSDEGGDRQPGGPPRRRRAERPRLHAFAEPTAQKPANRCVRAQRGRSGSGQGFEKGRRAEAVSAQRLSADGPEHQTEQKRPSGASAGLCGRRAGRNARGPAVRTQ